MSEPVDMPGAHRQGDNETPGSPGCQPRAVWFDLCAGRHTGLDSLALLNHAAGCRNCGATLREVSNLLAEEPTEEEEAQLIALKTSSSAGQRRLAETLRRKTEADRRSTESGKPKWFQGWWPAIAAVAAVAVVAVSLLAFRQLSPSDTRLLAEAYNKHRVSELRIPGSLPVALASPTRGNAPADVSSSELLQVKLRAQQAFEKNPNNAALRQSLGRIAIIEHDGKTALEQFEMAQALDPTLPGIKFDLGTAYFEIAESPQGKPLDYARAIDFFGQHLQDAHQQDALALFNRALCWERQNIDSEAIKDFEAAKKIEKDPKWLREIDQHLQSLKNRDARGASATKPADLTPSAFLAHHQETPGEYEQYLDASRDWLPHRNENTETDKALHQLAAIGANHGDSWLQDMLKRPPTQGEISAEQALSQALRASGKVRADEALAASTNATKLFAAVNNEPGRLRAQIEHVYNLQLVGQGNDCLSEALPLLKNPRLALYSWLRGYLELEVAACSVSVGKLDVGLQMAEDAGLLAHSHGLARQRLRASGFIADYQALQGNLVEAWSTASSALLECYAIPSTKNRQYQLIFDMEGIVKTLNLHWTQVGLADAALQATSGTENLRAPAFASEALGLAQLQVNMNVDARHSFEDADVKLAKLDTGDATARYRADWKTDRALLHARESGITTALKELSDQEPIYKKPDVPLPRLHYFATYSELLMESHQPQESIKKSLEAIETARRLLPAVHSEQQQRTWIDTASPAYEDLTLGLSQIGETEAALRTWESFRAAPYRFAYKENDQALQADFANSLPAIPKQPRGTLTIIFAHLKDQYFVWSFSDYPEEPLHLRVLSTSAREIENQASAFERLCEEPHSSQQDLRLLGSALYRELLLPFQDQIDRAKLLQVDLDSSLSRVPFAALSYGDRFLGLEHPLLFLPPWWVLSETTNQISPTDGDKLPEHARLLVVRQTSSDQATRIPEEYDESADIVARFPQAQTQQASFQRSSSDLLVLGGPALKRMLAEADLVHYSGHGLEENPAPKIADAGGETPVMMAPGSLKRCSLVVLAACRTRSEREDVLNDDPSFERIMLASGARDVLGAQWNVDSAMTRKLMVRFYAELAGHQTFMEALRRAQKDLQSQPASSHPYFWSAFQLVGQ
jgi:CHAT domain-containing protein/cytochrome c-type biogenesis protein CcmH/NrfG